MYFEVEYVIESDGGVHLVQVDPYCRYVENKFLDGVFTVGGADTKVKVFMLGG